MPQPPLDAVVRQLRQFASCLPAGGDVTDELLLEQFIATHDEAAFTALVQRHGPMVLGVCRRVLKHKHDAEDVFQATFLILARKAAAIRRRGSVGCWLHGVARRLAIKSRTRSVRRQANERQAADMRKADPHLERAWQELQAILDEEIGRLPKKHGEPIILCYLEGKTQEEAARQLGWPLGTVRGRLARGRDQLRSRLARRGLALAAGPFTALLATSATPAALPAELFAPTVRASVLFAAGRLATDVASPKAAALAEYGMRAFAAAKLKLVIALFVVTGALAGSVLAYPGRDSENRESPIENRNGISEPQSTILDPRSSNLDRHGDALPPGALARLGTVRFRHGEAISVLAFLPDGKTLVSAGYDNAVRHWEVPSGRVLRQFSGHHSCVTSLSLIQDGQALATGGNDNTIHVWDLATGKELQRIVGHRQGGLCIAYAPDGKTLASGSHDQTIILWDTATGKPRREPLLQQGEVTAIAFTPDGTQLISGSSEGTIQVWQAGSGEQVRQLKGHRGKVWSIAVSPDGKMLATSGGDATVRQWDLAQGTEVRPLPGPRYGVGSVTFVPLGQTLATTTLETGIRLWDVGTGNEVGSIGKGRGASAVAFSPNGQILAAAEGGHPVIRLWDVKSGKELHSTDGHHGQLGAAVFTPNGQLVATGGQDGSIRLWRPRTGELAGEWRGHRHAVNSLAFSPDGQRLVSAGQDGKVRLWDVAAGKEVCQLPGHQNAVFAVAFSPDGKVFTSAGFEQIRLWNAADGRELARIQPPQRDAFYSVAISPNGRTLASGDFKGVTLWEASTGKEIRRWRLLASEEEGIRAEQPKGFGYLHGVASVAFSSDGRLLTTASRSQANMREYADRRVRLWDVASGKVWRTLSGHQSEVTAVAFSPAGQTVASASADGTIRLWELATGNERRRFTGHAGLVVSLAFSPDSRSLVSASADTTALIWDVTGLAVKDAAPVAQPRARDLEALWADLANTNAEKAHRAIWGLAAADQAVRFLRQRLRPVPVLDPSRLGQLLKDLDNDRFETRERATDELRQVGDAAEPALQELLRGRPPLEVRRRVERLLEELQASEPSGDRLRELRALEALEHLGTPEARNLLTELGQGRPGARLTKYADSALERLQMRTQRSRRDQNP